MKLPAFTITQRREHGTHYVVHTIRLANGRVIDSQVGPYSDADARARVAAYVNPRPPPIIRPIVFGRYGSKPGPKPKGYRAPEPATDETEEV